MKESKDYGNINDVFSDGEKLYVLFQMGGTSKANLAVYDLSDTSSPSLMTTIRYGRVPTGIFSRRVQLP